MKTKLPLDVMSSLLAAGLTPTGRTPSEPETQDARAVGMSEHFKANYGPIPDAQIDSENPRTLVIGDGQMSAAALMNIDSAGVEDRVAWQTSNSSMSGPPLPQSLPKKSPRHMMSIAAALALTNMPTVHILERGLGDAFIEPWTEHRRKQKQVHSTNRGTVKKNRAANKVAKKSRMKNK